MAVARATAHARKLQGDHTNHHPASAVPDRAVKIGSETVSIGANTVAKTCYSTGAEQADTTRDTNPPDYSGTGG